MGIKQLKVDVNEVTTGMFVSGLDRPWTQTPFPLQGFYVKDLDEIKQLQTHCKYVYIDVARGSGPLKSSKLRSYAKGPGTPQKKESRAPQGAKVADVAPIKVRHNAYPPPKRMSEEIDQAKDLHHQVYTAVADVMTQVGEGASHIAIQDTTRAASAMVGSVLRSPDAFTWLTRVREKDAHTYSHAVRSAVWAILFGRHIGISRNDLDILVLGVLLKDLGKTKLPNELLVAKQRDAGDQKYYESFVELGVEILKSMDGISPRVISVVKTHCERINGSGFPQHLRGDAIPLLGKIAAIVTYYDETINPRGQKNPLPPSKAVAKLYEARGIEFQTDLVVEFIRAIGLYPTGTLVELNTGEVAVVVEQNFERRLKPCVMIVTDSFKKTLDKPVFLDMMADDKAKQQKIDAGKVDRFSVESIEIAQDLEPDAYDIDISSVRDDYIERFQTKGLFSFLRKGKGRSLTDMFG